MDNKSEGGDCGENTAPSPVVNCPSDNINGVLIETALMSSPIMPM